MAAQDLNRLLAEADARNGFPKGTMASVMQQESGGNNKFLDDPAAYHYAAGADGRRVAPHTGKVSTAFGPFGILESTAADPGYGVAPLKSKDLGEQVRFASDYLAARSKQAGGLTQGLAGYGEGEKYAQQVQGRVARNGEAGISRGTRRPQPGETPVVPADPAASGITELAARSPAEQVPAQLAEVAPQPMPSTADQEAWVRFQQQMPRQEVAQVPIAQQLASFGNLSQVPDFEAAGGPVAPQAIDFRTFGQWGQRGRA